MKIRTSDIFYSGDLSKQRSDYSNKLCIRMSATSNAANIYGKIITLGMTPCGQFHVTTDTTQKNKSSYAEYLVLVLYCTHITCHGFKGNMQIQLNNSEISPFAQLCEKL